jgi:hypothetical protein
MALFNTPHKEHLTKFGHNLNSKDLYILKFYRENQNEYSQRTQRNCKDWGLVQTSDEEAVAFRICIRYTLIT